MLSTTCEAAFLRATSDTDKAVTRQPYNMLLSSGKWWSPHLVDAHKLIIRIKKDLHLGGTDYSNLGSIFYM